MILDTVWIENYKSFGGKQSIQFSNGINIIVGENNSGKSSLLEAISGRFEDRPHIAGWMKHRESAVGPSKVTFMISVTIDDLCRAFESHNTVVSVAFPKELLGNGVTPERWIDDFNRFGAVFRGTRTGNDSISSAWDPFLRPANHRAIDLDPVGRGYTSIRLNVDQIQRKLEISKSSSSTSISIEAAAFQGFLREIYCFRAERLAFMPCQLGNSMILQPDARNLAEVLINLQANKRRFAEFCEIVSYILPNIKDISARPINSSLADVFISNIDPEIARDHHYFSLSQCGTGVGQILSLVYVAVTSHTPRVIVIDEPNSFLHPGAIRRFMEVCTHFADHQFILATHAPEIISTSSHKSSVAIRWKGDHSEIFQDNIETVDFLRMALDCIDLRLSDVFGYDGIVWVEGPTEARCFPLILGSDAAWRSRKLAFVPVTNTGDFERKNRNITIEAHKRLAEGTALVPPTVGFILDKERRQPFEVEALSKMAGGQFLLTTRRTYENFLLDPDAIAHVFNQNREGLAGAAIVSPQSVESWILANGHDIRLGSWSVKFPVFSAEWLESVDGAKLLEALFAEIDEVPEQYRKTIHSVWATEFILSTKPNLLNDLRKVIEILMPWKDDKVELRPLRLSTST